MRATQLSQRVFERAGGEGLPSGFAELPAIVYANDPLWIPEERADLERAFDRSNAWFNSGAARLFCLPGFARVAVFRDPHMRVNGAPVAFFGYWESTGDAGTEALVMRGAELWARGQGARALLGPINFSTFGTYRLRLRAEPGALPFPAEAYNPQAYPVALESLGFSLVQRYLSQEGPFPRERWEENRESYRALRTGGYAFHALTADVWLERLTELHALVECTFAANLAYTPIAPERFARECGERFIAKACPLSSTIAIGPEGDIAGFLLVFPNYGPLVVQGAGEGRIRVCDLNYREHMPMLAARGPVQAIAKTIGVSPRHRRNGLMNALVVAMCERGAADRYQRWLTALIREDNVSRRFGEGRAASERWYGLYAKSLESANGAEPVRAGGCNE